MKQVVFLGDSRSAIRAFPDVARNRAGAELRAVQLGLEPGNWKPMKTVGDGVRELRIADPSGAFRIIYLARLADRVLVLHAFRKTSQKTQKADLVLATRRLREWKNDYDGRNL